MCCQRKKCKLRLSASAIPSTHCQYRDLCLVGTQKYVVEMSPWSSLREYMCEDNTSSMFRGSIYTRLTWLFDRSWFSETSFLVYRAHPRSQSECSEQWVKLSYNNQQINWMHQENWANLNVLINITKYYIANLPRIKIVVLHMTLVAVRIND